MLRGYPITDGETRRIAEALAGSLSLVYLGTKKKVYQSKGKDPQGAAIAGEQRRKIRDFAKKRSRLIQVGINERIDLAGNDPVQEKRARQEIQDYNTTWLIPFLLSWGAHQGVVDGYEELALLRNPEQLWVWTQNTDYPDDCSAAAAASPGHYDDLVSVTGSPPPVHERCQCDLAPV